MARTSTPALLQRRPLSSICEHSRPGWSGTRLPAIQRDTGTSASAGAVAGAVRIFSGGGAAGSRSRGAGGRVCPSRLARVGTPLPPHAKATAAPGARSGLGLGLELADVADARLKLQDKAQQQDDLADPALAGSDVVNAGAAAMLDLCARRQRGSGEALRRLGLPSFRSEAAAVPRVQTRQGPGRGAH